VCYRFPLPHLSPVMIDRVDQVDGTVVVADQLRGRGARCRRCGRVSTRADSRYRRHLADLTVSGPPVEVMLTVHRLLPLLRDTFDDDWVTFSVSTSRPFLASDRDHRRAGRQGRFSSLRCGDSTLTLSSAATKQAQIEEWT